MRKELEREESDLQKEEKKILARLEEIKKEKEFYANNPEYEIADMLHETLCQYNHVDGCSYHYEKWDENLHRGAEKLWWLKKAQDFLAAFGTESTLKMISILKRSC